jgi:hypothetical protein
MRIFTVFRVEPIVSMIRGGTSLVMELVNAIDGYVYRHNERPAPFIWTASGKDILEKVKRGGRPWLMFDPCDIG